METSDVFGRRLQIFNGDDFIMLADLESLDRPTSITMCQRNGALTGFQVFYGSFSEKAGSAHGDLSTDCVSSVLNVEIVEVSLFGSTTGTPFLEGMSIVLQPFRDGVYPGNTISAGLVNQVGQKKRTVRFPAKPNSQYKDLEFFGFKTTSNGNVINNVSIVAFDPLALYASKQDFTVLNLSKKQELSYTKARKTVAGILGNRALM